jgi:sigma-B regulation protein RsbU (phosphoserine phosphatase)
MRDKIYLSMFLAGAGALLFLGRGLLEKSAVVTWGLTFGGTTAAAVLGMALYRVQFELRASRHELARKEAELNFALQVQQALFPRYFPGVESGLEFAAVCVPARGISGDYYDVIRLGDGRIVFTVADISGKGISAAILMSSLQAVSRTQAEAGLSPAEVCSKLNRYLYRVTDESRFATFFYGEWNPSERRLRYVNAGHPVPIVIGCNSSREFIEGGPPLGLFLDYQLQVGTATLQPDDLIALYSDGITEAGSHKDKEFGETRLAEVVAAHCRKPLLEIQQHVLEAARKWSAGEQEDDMTLLLVRVIKNGPPHQMHSRRDYEDQRASTP